MGGTSLWSSEVWDAAAFGTHPGGEEQRFMFVLEGGSKSSASVKHFSKVSLENEVQVSMSSKFEIISKEFGKPFDILGIKLNNIKWVGLELISKDG